MAVFHNQEGVLMPLSVKPISKTSGARMGAAVNRIGDINNDGCEDFVVGAPGEEGGGAIYVFRGRRAPVFLDTGEME